MFHNLYLHARNTSYLHYTDILDGVVISMLVILDIRTQVTYRMNFYLAKPTKIHSKIIALAMARLVNKITRNALRLP